MKTLLIWQVWLGAFFPLGTNDQFSWACIGELGKSIRILKVRQNGRKTKTSACHRKGLNGFSILHLVSRVYSN
jgi:hypothetical protein